MVWIHTSKKPIRTLADLSCEKQRIDMKPAGFWLGLGDSWLNYVKTEMPHWHYKYTYKCNFKRNINLYKIDTVTSLNRFISKYGINSFITFIDWQRVCKDYDGLIVNNYKEIYDFVSKRVNKKYTWFSSFDIDCACIWKPSAVISSMQRI